MVAFLFFAGIPGNVGNGSHAFIGIAFAEEEDEDEDDDKKKETVEVTRYEVRQVVRTVVVLAPEYETDTDGDLLVDGIDPDPRVHQREYFTDTDGDGIPNVFDRHHGEDDFAYYDGEEDADSDGLLDSYERLAER